MDRTVLLLGVDFGSGGCKITAVDGTGRVLGEASTEYATYYEHPGWSEQNPGDWLRAMCASLRKIQDQGVELAGTSAVAFDGSTHNAVLLDEDMKPIRKTIMWTDQRSTAECEFLKKELGDRIFQLTYQSPAPTWTLPQLLWLKKHEPEVLRKTRHILFVKDYVRFQLTGRAVTDRIEAQGTLFFNMADQTWAEELFALTGLSTGVLPDLCEPVDPAGRITADGAALTGIPEGTPVICGTSDSAAEDYGAGAVMPGDCIVKLATAGNVNVMTAAPHPHPRTLTYGHVIPGMWYTVSATNAAALCQRWFRDCFYESSGKEVFQEMNRLAENSPPGANGVFFHPYLQGERSPYWDADLRGSFTGLSISTARGDLLRALLEGVAFSLYDCYGLIEFLKLPVKQIFLIGGGAKSRLWSTIVCDVFNLPVKIPFPADASFGTALIAGTGIGVFPDCRTAVKKCLNMGEVFEPDADRAAKYRELFSIYRELHDVMAPVYRKFR